MKVLSRQSMALILLTVLVGGMSVQTISAKDMVSKTAAAKQKAKKAGRQALTVSQKVARTFISELKKNIAQNPYTSDKLSIGFRMPDAVYQEITGIPGLDLVFKDPYIRTTYNLGFSGAGDVDQLLPTLGKNNIMLHPEAFNGKVADALYKKLLSGVGKIDSQFQAFFKVVFPYPTVDYPMVYLFKVVQLMATVALSKGKGTFTTADKKKITVPTFKEVPGELFVLTMRLFDTAQRKDPDKVAFMVDVMRNKIPGVLKEALNFIKINGTGMTDFLFDTMEMFQEAYKYDFNAHLDRQLNLKGAFTRGFALMNLFVHNRKTLALAHFNVLKKRAKTDKQKKHVAALGKMMQKKDVQSELKALFGMMKLTAKIMNSEFKKAKTAHKEGGSGLGVLFRSLHIVQDINNATDSSGKKLHIKAFDANIGKYIEVPMGIMTFVIREMLRFHVLTHDLRSKMGAGAIDKFFDSIGESVGIDLNELVNLFTGIPTEAVEGVPAASEVGSIESVGADEFDLDDFVDVGDASDSDSDFLIIEDDDDEW